ncbi:MAG: cation:proton antiporter [Microthrixaceae bacterium]
MLAIAPAEVTTAFLQLGAILLGLSVLARAALRAGFSPIPLYLIGGLLVGVGGLIPSRITDEFVEVAAEIGVLLLLFALGLEYTPAELSGELKRNFRGGVVDLVANFVPGALLALVLGWGAVPAVLLGGVTYISSSGVISKLLADLDRLGNRETGTVLSILVLEDLVMAVYLPIVGVLLASSAVLTGLVSLGVALIAVAVIITFAVRFGPWLSRMIHSESDEVLMLSVLGMVLLVGGLAQEVQVSAAVGAFLVGLAISGPAQHRAGPLLEPLRDLFAAIFFFVFALGIDPATLPGVLVPAVLLAAVTGTTKIVVGWWAAGRSGVGKHGRWRAGTMLVPRGEFSVVIAGLAVAAGVEPRLGPLTAAYVLVLAVAGSFLVRMERLPSVFDRSARAAPSAT